MNHGGVEILTSAYVELHGGAALSQMAPHL